MANNSQKIITQCFHKLKFMDKSILFLITLPNACTKTDSLI
ncbi:hypothetical protein AO364_1584 [Moraxella catarrhalis]|nr:hypothetical protein AO364_1584 [Moraxella catarrhalis]